jgi:hypothetical protein
LDGSPGGGTPLCYHVNQVAEQIAAIAPELKAAGNKAALIICSDGEASDGDITDALRPLNNPPVWVVIRLCTNEEPVVSYWSNIDSQLELNMDVPGRSSWRKSRSVESEQVVDIWNAVTSAQRIWSDFTRTGHTR